MKLTNSFFAILSSALLLSGCASYRATALNNPPEMILSSPACKSNEIFIAAKKYTMHDCNKYLDRDVIANGFQPIQLYIQNNTNRSYIFSSSRVSLPCANSYEVANRVHTSTVGRAAGYGVASLVLWPLIIPAIVDGVKSANANDALDRDFFIKTASDQMINPYSYFNKIIFVPKTQYCSTFNITLIDVSSNQPVVFNVTVN